METVFYSADVSVLSDETLFAAAYRAVPHERQEKIDRLRFPADKRLSLGAALLLQFALGEAGIPTGETRFTTRDGGKPCLDGGCGVFFNLSHSGTVAVCAVAPCEVGCDVEKIADGGLRIAKRFFHPAEYEWLTEAPEEEQRRRFYRLWTLKESFLKATGEGMRLALDSFSVVPTGGGEAGRGGSVPPVPHGGHRYCFSEITDIAGYSAAVCVCDADPTVTHRNVDLRSIVTM